MLLWCVFGKNRKYFANTPSIRMCLYSEFLSSFALNSCKKTTKMLVIYQYVFPPCLIYYVAPLDRVKNMFYCFFCSRTRHAQAQARYMPSKVYSASRPKRLRYYFHVTKRCSCGGIMTCRYIWDCSVGAFIFQSKRSR